MSQIWQYHSLEQPTEADLHFFERLGIATGPRRSLQNQKVAPKPTKKEIGSYKSSKRFWWPFWAMVSLGMWYGAYKLTIWGLSSWWR